MRRVLLFAVSVLAGGPALAADSPPPTGAAAEPPVCTTVTTVVKRGDVVLSTDSKTRCEDAAHPGGGLHPGAVLAAPEAVLSAPVAVLGALGGPGDLLTARNTAGDWRVVDGRTGDVCHLFLSVRTTKAGFTARPEGCPQPLKEAAAWSYRDGATEVLTPDGRVIVRLTGTRDRIGGSSTDGDTLTLQR